MLISNSNPEKLSAKNVFLIVLMPIFSPNVTKWVGVEGSVVL